MEFNDPLILSSELLLACVAPISFCGGQIGEVRYILGVFAVYDRVFGNWDGVFDIWDGVFVSILSQWAIT